MVIVADEVGLLTGEPLMCVIIFAGEKNRDLVELGVDPFVVKLFHVSADGVKMGQ